MSRSHDIHVALVRVGDDGTDFVVAESQVLLKPTEFTPDAIAIEHDSHQEEGLTCELDVATCEPTVATLVVPNRPDGLLMAGDILEVQFEAATNQPRVSTKDDIDAILDFPIDIGDQLEGTWITLKVLRIRILTITTDVWVANITQVPAVKLRPEVLHPRHFRATGISFRIAVPGLYAWRLVIPDAPSQLELDSSHLEISADCAPAAVIYVVESTRNEARSWPPPPVIQVRGTVALDGSHALHLPDTSVPHTPSWSLLFWIYLSQDSTGSHRTLFYKGPGHNQHRTPSAWLQPHDRRLILRVSTPDNMDVGMTTTSELPLHEWVLLSFTFDNTSAVSLNGSKDDRNKTFSYVYAINGKVDTEMNVHHSVVLPNSGGLYVGGNPWMDGVRGFMQNVRLYAAALTTSQIQTVFRQEYGRLLSSATVAGQLSAIHRDQRHIPVSDQTMTSLMQPLDEPALAELLRMGEAYLYGTDTTPNATLAAWHFKQALRAGEAAAAKPLALIYALDRHTQAVALYHYAASMGDVSSMTILGRRYEKGDGVDMDAETAAFYYYHAAAEASRAYHVRGNQPLHEMNSLFHADDVNVAQGQEGDNDKWIQFQKMRADKDEDVEAMVAMGDLYYWGARGCVRDHSLAFQYFERAATLGSPHGMSAAGGMLLKGEGTAQDNETAIRWYEQAATFHNVRALNGLGYIHFYGTANCTQNQTKGLEYFEQAAAQHTDGDSLFNAGYCHFAGHGTPANATRALAYFRDAARSFGHFDSIFELGKVALNVDGTFDDRHLGDGITYLRAASAAGDWGKVARQGFDAYLKHEYHHAIWLYHEAREYGYPVAAGNLAFLYDAAGLNNSATYLLEATEVEASLRLGDCYYYGKCGVESSVQLAMYWYTRASADGVSVGAYNVGFMNEYGIGGLPVNVDRAKQYYERAMDLSPSWETWFVITLSMYRLKFGPSFGRTTAAAYSPVKDSFHPASTLPTIDWENIGLGVVIVVLVAALSVQYLRRS
ncbi:hypothetical protein DYB38_005911 [Aphanomyces astaci]|uniref:LamG-like jellyroll fold domain-containing protein n=1 Tax=Aphanomyces astaci TaxID=112090 RepID=A0A397CYJ2_APHAT|nr:hypothetical protein DYB38_005911 [Aphanomyces astaci]